jgi:hypothetical protein
MLVRLTTKIPVLALLLVTSAFAVETDNAPGAFCVPISGATMTQLPGGEIQNGGTQTVTVNCPANRKTVGGVYTTRFSGIVFGRDNNSSTNLCCRALSSSPSATVTGTEICTSGVTPAANYSQLTLPEITDASTASHFYIQCKVPAKNTSDQKMSLVYSFRSIQQ